MDRWQADPDGVAAEIAALPPVAQLAAVEAILVADPAGVGRLCGGLPEGDARQRCRTVQTRPHLWVERPPAGPPLPSPLAQTAPATGRCDALANPTVCWSRYAAGRAEAGVVQEAAAGCMAIAAGQWREECMFQAAEVLLEARGANRYGDAVALCALSGDFVGDCLEHSIARLAAHAPTTPGGDWGAIQAAAAAITAHWEGAAAGETQRAMLWALSSALVYAAAPGISSAPLTVLPADAAPHVRAAMAWRQLQLSPKADLTTLTTQLLDAPAEDTAPPARPPRALVGLPDLWGAVPPPDGAATTTWMGCSTRIVSPAPAADFAIALLEAAARQPGQGHRITQGLEHPDPLVAWTARRLAR